MRWLTNPVVQFLAAGFVTLVVVVARDQRPEPAQPTRRRSPTRRSLTAVLARSVAAAGDPAGPA